MRNQETSTNPGYRIIPDLIRDQYDTYTRILLLSEDLCRIQVMINTEAQLREEKLGSQVFYMCILKYILIDCQ